MLHIDLNGDMGESFGVYTIGNDKALMHYVTSVNIACGAHAGDANTMDNTIQSAKRNAVAIGAHPGFPDLAGFGRRMISYSPDEIFRMMVWQLGGLKAFCDIHEATLHHVKPHGALYNLAATDKAVAQAITDAIVAVDPSLIMYGLANGALLQTAKQSGLSIASEVFADRTYQSDGTLTPRNEPGAMIHNVEDMEKQVDRMIRFGEVVAVSGEVISIQADTICVHGDSKQALLFAGSIHSVLNQAGIRIEPISKTR